MWPTLKCQMNSPSLPVARPWTPPEEAVSDPESSPPSDYFSDATLRSSVTTVDSKHSDDSQGPGDLGSRWPDENDVRSSIESLDGHRHNSSKSGSHKNAHPQSDAANAARTHLRPQPSSRAATEPSPSTKMTHYENGGGTPQHPHTPSKSRRENAAGALQYPYTPDSARMPRLSTMPILSPLSPMLWDDDLNTTSPVQHVLSSCISHFESLLRTRQPTDDQMEYIIAQFEAMTQRMFAPEPQSRQSDDHLFPELDVAADGAGLGITGSDSKDIASNHRQSRIEDLGHEYVREVGNYIESVRNQANELRMRLDEVKQLNSIQLDIINDLRQQLSKQDEADEANSISSEKQGKTEEPAESPKSKVMKRPTQRRVLIRPGWAFFKAIGDAIDDMGETLLEW